MNKQEQKTLWEKLFQQQLVTEEVLPFKETLPWYIAFFQGFLAWIASFFVLGLCGSLLAFIFDQQQNGLLLALGLILCGIAFTIFKSKEDRVFVEQCALAICMAGQLLLTWFFFEIDSWFSDEVFLYIAIMQVVMLLIMDNYLQRLLSAIFAMVSAYFWLIESGFQTSLLPLAVIVFVLAWVNDFRLKRFHAFAEPIAFGLIIAIIIINVLEIMFHTEMSWVYRRGYSPQGHWLFYLLVTAYSAGFIYLGRAIIRSGFPEISNAGKVYAAVLIITLVAMSYYIPGFGVSVLVLMLGFYLQRKSLLSLGILSLVCFSIWYYYSLQQTLLMKSLYLLIAGLLMLAFYLALHVISRDKDAEKGSLLKPVMTAQSGFASLLIFLVLVLGNMDIAKKEQHIAEGQRVLLELNPKDPFSIMQGEYMALRFAITGDIRNDKVHYSDNLDAYIIATLDENQVAHFDSISTQPDAGEGKLAMQFRVRDGKVKFATNAFFFQQGTAKTYNAARYGVFRVNQEGGLLLTHMANKDFVELGVNQP